jgi:hypothetical protein
MIWARHVAHMGEVRNAYNILVGKAAGKTILRNVGIDLKIILERNLRKQRGKVWTACIWRRIQTSCGLL